MSHVEVLGPVTREVSQLATLPMWAVVVPLIGAFLAGLSRKVEKLRNVVVVATTAVTLGIVLAMYGPVVQGIHIHGYFYKGIEFTIKGILAAGFKVDPVSLLIAVVTSFLWLVSSIYAISYMSHKHARTRFAVFLLLALSVDLGVLLAKDWFSLFVFFEMLGIFSTMLVIHEETKEALDAAKLYLSFCIIGGLILLAGVVMLYSYTGVIDIQPMADLIEKTIPAATRYIIAALMIIGFGAKAGIFFLHVWLPEAYQVAPTPANALSGVMTKVGAYGILRTVHTLYAPAEGISTATLTNLGYGLVLIGALTMIGGAINAMLSSNCKRMLAYSSVSQMGYIIFGLGCAAYLAQEGAMGMAGSLYHIINHALFKGALFLCVGAVYFRTHELDMRKLGGLWRNMPITALVCLAAVFGITGMPFFNGYVSKTLLHHSIIEAWEHSGNSMFLFAEIILMLSAFSAWIYGMKMWIMVFAGKRPEKYKSVKPEPILMRIPLITLATCIVFIGLRPNFLLEKLVGPALAFFGYETSSHAYRVLYNVHVSEGIRSTIPILYDPRTLSFFNSEVLHNLLSGGMTVLCGGALFILGFRFGWFKLENRTPEGLSVKNWYLALARTLRFALRSFAILRWKVHLGIRSYILSAERTTDEVALKMALAISDEKVPLEKLRLIESGAIKLIEAPENLTEEEIFWLRKAMIRVDEILAEEKEKTRIELGKALKLAARMEEIIIEERSRAEKGLRRFMPFVKTMEEKLTEEKFEPVFEKTMEEYRKLRFGYRSITKGALHKFFVWLRRMIIAATIVLSEERFGTVEEAVYSALDVADTRRMIRSFTRDIYLNVSLYVLIFIAFSLCLFYVQ